MSFSDRGDLDLLRQALELLDEGFTDLPEVASRSETAAVRRALLEAAERMRDNYPYHHPLYIGQMLKPPHPVARLAYNLSTYLNPNNHALDGGRASSEMEKEAVREIAAMFGWSHYLGHLTGGGTIANFEALWVARELRPGRTVAASSAAHYTHSRLSAVLGVPFREVAVDPLGRMDTKNLQELLETGEIGTVVVTLSTTSTGAVDPLPEILALKESFGFRIHVDAAYGGYFRLARNLRRESAAAFERIDEADSIVVDPHKHGLQPYGCGCVLFRDPTVGRFYRHDSPYTYFSSDDLHLGEISLECSRAGASAVALWTTMRVLPLVVGGELARDLETGREAALSLHAALSRDERFEPLLLPETDIVVWAVRAPSASEASRRARRLFETAAEEDLHLALATFPRKICEAARPVAHWDDEQLTCLRACTMKPEHREWLPEILRRLDRATTALGPA